MHQSCSCRERQINSSPYTHSYKHTTLVIDDSNLRMTFTEREVEREVEREAESGVATRGLKPRNTRWILMY